MQAAAVGLGLAAITIRENLIGLQILLSNLQVQTHESERAFVNEHNLRRLDSISCCILVIFL